MTAPFFLLAKKLHNADYAEAFKQIMLRLKPAK